MIADLRALLAVATGGDRRIAWRLALLILGSIGSDFVAHFIESYRLELAAWADASLAGSVVGANAWDGYVANLVAASGVVALESGRREVVDVPARPDLYA